MEYSAADKVLHGKVVGINDIVTYEATNVEEFEREFRTSVDDYIGFCEESGKDPEKLYSGKFVIRMDAELSCRLASRAELEQKSLNAWLITELERLAQERDQEDRPGRKRAAAAEGNVVHRDRIPLHRVHNERVGADAQLRRNIAHLNRQGKHVPPFGFNARQN